MKQYQINIEAVKASDQINPLDPNYEVVKNLVVLRAVVQDGEQTLELFGKPVEDGKESESVHSLLCTVADAIRQKEGVSLIIRA